ncbi:hypothetical protein Tco_1352222 [Tanacetum coccineum]
MRTRSSSNLIIESSTTLKCRNHRCSKQRVKPFSLEETFIVTMANQRTMAKLLQAPTEGYGDAIVIPAILAENFELKHGLLNLQFWATAKVKTVNREVQIQALVDKKKGSASLRQSQEQVGEGLEIPTNSHHTPTTTQPSTSKPQKKQSRRKHGKDTKVSQPVGPTEPMADETTNVESVPIHSNDPLLSGEDRLKLNELMELCMKLSERVLALETTKTNPALEIDSLKRRGRKIADIDADAEKEVSTAEVAIDSTTTTTIDELTLAQTLIEIKAVKPKVVTTAATTTTTAVTRPKRLARQREEDANISEWDNIQAMMDTDYELAARLQVEEQGELTIEEKSRLFVELINKRKKHFARLRAEEHRRKPPAKAQNRNTMSTYLKNMAGYKHNQLKTKSFEDIQMLFDKEMKRVNIFVDMNTELVKGSETRTEGSSKRVGEELESENLKKRKLNENVEAELDDDQEEAEMKKHMKIVLDDEVAIDAIPLATKPLIIMLQNIDREDLETLWKLVKAKHGLTRLEEGYERVLWGDLKVMFEPDVESEVWRNLQGHKVTVWKLFSSSGLLKLMIKQLKNLGSV